jgi:hypothetical protein
VNHHQRQAEILHRLRMSAIETAGCGRVTIATVEALLWIAAGVDNTKDLGVAMGQPGRPQAAASTNRILSALRGRDRMTAGRWVPAPFQLIRTRRHPHRRGYLLTLTPEAEELLGGRGGVDTPLQIRPNHGNQDPNPIDRNLHP